MDSVLQLLQDVRDGGNLPLVCAVTGGVGLVSSIVIYKVLTRKGPPKLKEAPPHTAVIYQFKRGPRAPSLSPFPIKMETFCRMAGIPYLTETSGRMSSKGKVPWMTYDGHVVEDSQFCLAFLKQQTGVDVNAHLDSRERAVSKLLQVMADEHIYWTIVYFRWVHPDPFFPNFLSTYFGFPRFLFPIMRRKLRGQVEGQGIGRHSPEQILNILMEDLQALSAILGSKPFMLGEKMCEGDCSVFGLLSQLVWHQEDRVLKDILKNNFPNLHDYCLRIKDKLWPDWDQQCQNQ